MLPWRWFYSVSVLQMWATWLGAESVWQFWRPLYSTSPSAWRCTESLCLCCQERQQLWECQVIQWRAYWWEDILQAFGVLCCPINHQIIVNESCFVLSGRCALFLGGRGTARATRSEWPQPKWLMHQQPFYHVIEYKAELNAVYSYEVIQRADSWPIIVKCTSQV